MPRVVIVGGGISGLAAAYYLAESDAEITLVERDSRLGGVIRTERVDGCLVEGGPDSFIAQKPWAMELIRELGMADEVIPSNDARRRTFVLRDGRLRQLPDGVQFLAPTKIRPMLSTRLFSWRAKLRMAAELLRRPRDVVHDRSVAEFVLDHYGPEVNEYLAQPMLAGVYGGSPESLSVNAVLPRFLELERRYGSLSRGMLATMARAPKSKRNKGGGLFLTLKGGMQRLTDALADRVRDRIQVIHAEAAAVRRVEGRLRVAMSDGESLAADQVVLAVPAWRAAEFVREQDEGLATLLGAIRYGSSITAALLYRRPEFDHPLDGFGFLVPRAEHRLLAACTWVNTKFDHRAPDDRPLLRAFIAGDQATERLHAPAAETAAAIGAELQQIMGFHAEPTETRVFAWDRAMAQYEVGHQSLVNRIAGRLEDHPGLHLGGNAFEGIGVPDCVRRSRAVAERIRGQSL